MFSDHFHFLLLIDNVACYLNLHTCTCVFEQIEYYQLQSNFSCVVQDSHNENFFFCCIPCIDYVEELRKLVFTMPTAEFKAVSEKYSAQTPQSLTTQFPERRRKDEAVKLHKERKKRLDTELYPSGKETCVTREVTF